MAHEVANKVVVIALFCVLSGVRLYYRLRVHRLVSLPEARTEGRGVVAFRTLLTGLLLAVVFLYSFIPGPIAWTMVSFPPAIRLPAAVLALASIALLAWAHRELGRSFDVTLRLRPDHQLVTSGPYRHIRHPIYLSYLLFFLSIAVVSGCLAMGLLGLLVIGLLMTVRLKREEAQLLERHGDSYRRYGLETGRFWPHWKRRGSRTGAPSGGRDGSL